MTLRTGKGGRYRYYTCSIKARQGETGCKARSIPRIPGEGQLPPLGDAPGDYVKMRS